MANTHWVDGTTDLDQVELRKVLMGDGIANTGDLDLGGSDGLNWDDANNTLMLGTATNRSTNSRLIVEGAAAEIAFYESDAGADEKLWRLSVNGDKFELFTRTDADAAGEDAFEILRTGTTITSVSFPNGNVGIGTNSPAQKFVVANSGSILLMANTAAQVFIGDENSNANMTTGLTINQGAADNQIICLKSTDITTALTSAGAANTETDDFLTIQKQNATLGGAMFQAIAEDAATAATLVFNVYGGTATTAKTTGAQGLIDFYVSEHDGANALANITANGNVFTIRARVGAADVARLLVDEDGDLYSVTAAQTFDDYDDIALVESYDRIRSKAAIAQAWDEYTQTHERMLIDAGVLGAPIAEGGMTNVTQLQRLHNGALRQLYGLVNVQNETISRLSQRLALLEA